MDAVRLSATARAVPRSGIRDVFDRAARIPGAISLAVGEPGATAPDHVVQAGNAAAAAGLTHYTDVLGVPELRRAAASYSARVKGLRYDPDTEIQATPGATLGLYLALQTILDPGDEVVVPSPHFTSYDAQIQLCGGRPVYVPLRPERGFRLTAADIAAAITPRTRAVIVNSPGNPTGAVTGAAELQRIARLCQEHDLWALSDEVYHPFVFEPEARAAADGRLPAAPSIAAVPGMKARTIVADSLSKTYAMTGWRIGYLLAPATVIEQTSKLAELINSSLNAPAQYAAVAALTGPDDFVRAAASEYRAKRDLVVAGLTGCPTVRLAAPEGAFYAFVDVRPTGLGSAEFSRRLLDEQHVAVVPGETFGAAGAGFVRVSFAGDADELVAGVRRLAEFAEQARAASGARGRAETALPAGV